LKNQGGKTILLKEGGGGRKAKRERQGKKKKQPATGQTSRVTGHDPQAPTQEGQKRRIRKNRRWFIQPEKPCRTAKFSTAGGAGQTVSGIEKRRLKSPQGKSPGQKAWREEKGIAIGVNRHPSSKDFRVRRKIGAMRHEKKI